MDSFLKVPQSTKPTIFTMHSPKEGKALPYLDKLGHPTFTKPKNCWNVTIKLGTSDTMERCIAVRNRCMSTLRAAQRKREKRLV